MTTCGYCGREVWWRIMFVTRRRNPLDVTPSPRGNVFVPEDLGDLELLEQLLDRDTAALEIGQAIAVNSRDARRLRQMGYDLHLSHWVTCPKAEQARLDVQARRA